jgi:hypothetical protein
MYTLYSQLTPEQQLKELKEFDPKHHQDVIEGHLCVLCGMALHNCLCTHED